MKKILQRCMAGLLTAVLCAGGVYAAEPEPTTITIEDALLAASKAEPVEFLTEYTHELGSQIIDWGEGDYHDYYNGVVYNLGELKKDDIITFSYSLNGMQTYLYTDFFYKGTDPEITEDQDSYEYTDGIYRCYIYDHPVEIPGDGNWYVALSNPDGSENASGELTVQFNKVTPISIEDAIAKAEDVPADGNITIGTQYIAGEDETFPGNIYKLGNLQAGDLLTTYFQCDSDYYKCIELFYLPSENADITEFIEFNSVGTSDYHLETWTIPAAAPETAIWYAFCGVEGLYNELTCEASIAFDVTNPEGAITSTLDFTETDVVEEDTYSWKDNTLTLKDGFKLVSDEDNAIVLPSDAAVVVEGDATIVTPDGDGIYTEDEEDNGKLTITMAADAELKIIGFDGIEADGSLIINGTEGSKLSFMTDDDAIYADMDITISNTIVDAKSDYSGIYTEYGSIIIKNNSELYIHADDYGISTYQSVANVTISDSIVEIKSNDYGIDCYGDLDIQKSKIDITSSQYPITSYSVNIEQSDLDLVSTYDDNFVIECSYDYGYQYGIIPIWLYGMEDILEDAEETEGVTPAEVQAALRELYAANLTMDAPLTLTWEDHTIPFTEDLIYVIEDNTYRPSYYYYDGGDHEEKYYIAVWSVNADGADPIQFTDVPAIMRNYLAADPAPEAPEAPEHNIAYNTPKMPFLFGLNVSVGENGSANASGSLLIARYATRNLKFTPDEGYMIADVLVNGKSVGAVSSYKVGPATESITVEVRFAPIPVEEPAVVDAAVDAAV